MSVEYLSLVGLTIHQTHCGVCFCAIVLSLYLAQDGKDKVFFLVVGSWRLSVQLKWDYQYPEC